jgi:hypothetical protein
MKLNSSGMRRSALSNKASSTTKKRVTYSNNKEVCAVSSQGSFKKKRKGPEHLSFENLDRHSQKSLKSIRSVKSD